MSMTESNGTTPKAVLVTGASTGIGESCALELARMGFLVYAGVRRVEDSNSLRAKAEGRLEPVILDVTKPESIEATRAHIERATGDAGMVGIVNNAGIVVAGPMEFVGLDDLRRQLEVNVVGQVAVTQAFLPLLRKSRGRVVNIGSIGGRMAVPFTGCYAISKFAMEAFSDALRMELKPWGMHVALVEPGAVKTPIWSKSKETGSAMRAEMPEGANALYGAQLDQLIKISSVMEKRGVDPGEVSKVVIHALTSPKPKTRYVVGREAKAQAMIRRVLPDRMIDNIVLGQMGLPKGSA
jgi:NAD(P)-dependent dehydrogenase (short-subunit alcohol dehydrogenase family)